MHCGTEINDDDDGDMTVLSAVSTEAKKAVTVSGRQSRQNDKFKWPTN